MPQNTEPIEIKQPPLEELKKSHSCARRSCTTGFGCIFIFLVVSLILFRFVFIPKIKELKRVPENFPKNITIYDADSVYRITQISGKEQNKTLETLAYLPKLILSPLIVIADQYHQQEINENLDGRDKINNLRSRKSISWDDFAKIVNKPVTGRGDLVQVEWLNLPASSYFISKYYQNEFTKSNYNIWDIVNEKNISKFKFGQANINGTLYIQDDANKPGTDYVALTVNIGEATTTIQK
jgi:hypothetical protein